MWRANLSLDSCRKIVDACRIIGNTLFVPANTTPTPADLFWTPATIGRARISYDRNSRTYSVWAPGHSIRSTKRYGKAIDLATGLA